MPSATARRRRRPAYVPGLRARLTCPASTTEPSASPAAGPCRYHPTRAPSSGICIKPSSRTPMASTGAFRSTDATRSPTGATGRCCSPVPRPAGRRTISGGTGAMHSAASSLPVWFARHGHRPASRSSAAAAAWPGATLVGERFHQGHVGAHHARVEVQHLLVGVGQTLDDGCATGTHVHGRGCRSMAHGQPRLAGVEGGGDEGGGVDDERVEGRVAVGVEVGGQGEVRAARYLKALGGDGRVLGLGVGTSRIDLDVVTAGGQLQGVGQGAGLEVGQGLLAVDVDVDGQAGDRVQDRHRRSAVVLSESEGWRSPRARGSRPHPKEPHPKEWNACHLLWSGTLRRAPCASTSGAGPDPDAPVADCFRTSCGARSTSTPERRRAFCRWKVGPVPLREESSPRTAEIIPR